MGKNCKKKKTKQKKIFYLKEPQFRNVEGKWFGVTIYKEKNNKKFFHKRYFICNLKQRGNKLVKSEIISFEDIKLKDKSNEYFVEGKILETHFLEMSWYSKDKNKINYAAGIFKVSNGADKIEGYYYGKSRHFNEIVEGDFRMFKEKDNIYLYDISISFAKNKRAEARRLANGLKEKGLFVFFDEFEEINLLGEDGIKYFYEVFLTSKIIVVFFDEDYGSTYWTKIEKNIIDDVKANKNKFLLVIDYTNNFNFLSKNIFKINGNENIEKIINKIYQKYKALQ